MLQGPEADRNCDGRAAAAAAAASGISPAQCCSAHRPDYRPLQQQHRQQADASQGLCGCYIGRGGAPAASQASSAGTQGVSSDLTLPNLLFTHMPPMQPAPWSAALSMMCEHY